MNIPITKPYLGKEEFEAAKEVLKSGWLVQGDKVVEFENMTKEIVGSKYAQACSNCTTALHMAVIALGIGRGDKVIVPAYTFVSTPNVVEYERAKVVFADISLETFNIAPNTIWDKIPGVSAIIPVHLFGLCADMGWILEWARREKIAVIEDAACALGSYGPSGNAGNMGDVGCFPYQTNILTDKGKTRIKDVKIGDKVRTVNNGGWGTVTETFKRQYKGLWCKLLFRCARTRDTMSWSLSMTEEHPVLIYRDGYRCWEKAKNLTVDDWVYVNKTKCKVCGRAIPTFWQLCEYCNPAEQEGIKEKISSTKDTGLERPSYHFNHYYQDILPYAEKLAKEGYRVVPIGVAVPDIIAIKDNKVFAYEIEHLIRPKRKLQKYTEETRKYYDDIIWIVEERQRNKKKITTEYVAEDDLVRIKPKAIERYYRKKPTTVFNLEVSGDHTYFAGGIAVHNCFSFHPRKGVTTGEGGMMTMNREELYNKVHALRDFGFGVTDIERHRAGSLELPQVDVLGFNYRLTNIQGAIGVEQMKKYDFIIGGRIKRAEIYNKELKGISWFRPPVVPYGYRHTYQSYCILVGDGYIPGTDAEAYIDKWVGVRQRMMNELKDKGISMRGGTHACHMLDYYAKRYNLIPQDYPNTYVASALLVTIPLFAQMTDDEQQYVIDALKGFKP